MSNPRRRDRSHRHDHRVVHVERLINAAVGDVDLDDDELGDVRELQYAAAPGAPLSKAQAARAMRDLALISRAFAARLPEYDRQAVRDEIARGHVDLIAERLLDGVEDGLG